MSQADSSGAADHRDMCMAHETHLPGLSDTAYSTEYFSIMTQHPDGVPITGGADGPNRFRYAYYKLRGRIRAYLGLVHNPVLSKDQSKSGGVVDGGVDRSWDVRLDFGVLNCWGLEWLVLWMGVGWGGLWVDGDKDLTDYCGFLLCWRVLLAEDILRRGNSGRIGGGRILYVLGCRAGDTFGWWDWVLFGVERFAWGVVWVGQSFRCEGLGIGLFKLAVGAFVPLFVSPHGGGRGPVLGRAYENFNVMWGCLWGKKGYCWTVEGHGKPNRGWVGMRNVDVDLDRGRGEEMAGLWEIKGDRCPPPMPPQGDGGEAFCDLPVYDRDDGGMWGWGVALWLVVVFETELVVMGLWCCCMGKGFVEGFRGRVGEGGEEKEILGRGSGGDLCGYDWGEGLEDWGVMGWIESLWGCILDVIVTGLGKEGSWRDKGGGKWDGDGEGVGIAGGVILDCEGGREGGEVVAGWLVSGDVGGGWGGRVGWGRGGWAGLAGLGDGCGESRGHGKRGGREGGVGGGGGLRDYVGLGWGRCGEGDRCDGLLLSLFCCSLSFLPGFRGYSEVRACRLCLVDVWCSFSPLLKVWEGGVEWKSGGGCRGGGRRESEGGRSGGGRAREWKLLVGEEKRLHWRHWGRVSGMDGWVGWVRGGGMGSGNCGDWCMLVLFELFEEGWSRIREFGDGMMIGGSSDAEMRKVSVRMVGMDRATGGNGMVGMCRGKVGWWSGWFGFECTAVVKERMLWMYLRLYDGWSDGYGWLVWCSGLGAEGVDGVIGGVLWARWWWGFRELWCELHLLSFHDAEDAKTLWSAIKARFGGNEASKKMQKNLLKQQFETFTIGSREELDYKHTKGFRHSYVYEDALRGVSIFKQQLEGYTQAASNKVQTAPNCASHSDEIICSFFAQQASMPTTHDDEDLLQIDEDAMEEIDIRWQVAMITARIRKFMRKTGRPIDLKPKNGITFDKSKIECFNCQKLGHFARECRFAKYQENRANGHKEKKIVAIEDSNSKALVATDNNEEIDWTKEFDAEPVTFAMMALTELEEDDWSMEIDAEPVHFGQDGLGDFDWSNKADDTPVSLALMATNSEVPYCSKCSKSYKQLLENYQTERDNFQKARSEILGYQMSLESLEVILKTHEKNEYAWGDKYEQMEYDLKLRDFKLEEKQKELDQVLKERDDFKVKLEKWTNAAVLQNEVLNKQRYLSDKSCIGFGVESSSSKESDNSSGNTNSTESLYPNFQKAKGFHAVPPPTDWVDSDDEETALNFSEIQKKTVLNSENSETSFENSPDHLIKDCNLHERTFKQTQTHKPKGTQGSKGTQDQFWNNINRVNIVTSQEYSRSRVPQAVLSQSTGRPYYPRPQRPKKIMKSIWVKKASTVGSQAVLPQNVNVKGSAMINPTQTWRPKGAYLDSVNRDDGSYTLKQFEYGNPEEDLKDYAIIDSGCSGSMTGDKDKLSDFKEFKGGYVAFGNDPKGGRITGKGTIKTSCIDFEKVSYVEELKFNLLSVSQICDKKHNVLFTDKECLILSPKFKFVDEDLVILRAPRKNDVYSLDLKNIIPSGGVTCLVAKATKDEAVLWHRRLGHVNFKNINKLVKGNLVRGLPSKTFKLDHSCLACRKGKQHRASCKKIEERTVRFTHQRL
ncbi:ribonuclease H-like domain-containing protein [Tanacetum coccineum]